MPNLPRVRIFYGWWIVSACFLLRFYGTGTILYGLPVFFSPFQEDLKLSATAISFAFTLRTLEGGVEGLIVGYLVDRIGPRPLMVAGSFIAGLGTLLLSGVNSLWEFYAAFLVMSLGASAVFGLVPMTAVANWFVRRRARALAILALGGGLGGLLAPALVWLIDTHGWRTAMAVIGVGFWSGGIPLAFLVRHRPEKHGYLPDGDIAFAVQPQAKKALEVNFSLRQALGTRSFWLLALAFMAASGSTQVVLVHPVRYLESINISREVAAATITGMTLTSLLGRLAFGWLGDFLDKRYVMAVGFGLQAIGMFIFASIRAPWMLSLFLATFGLSYVVGTILRPAILADYYGRRSLGIIQGMQQTSTIPFTMAYPILAGWVFDELGTYRPALYGFAGLTVVAIPFMLLARRPTVNGEKAKL